MGAWEHLKREAGAALSLRISLSRWEGKNDKHQIMMNVTKWCMGVLWSEQDEQ